MCYVSYQGLELLKWALVNMIVNGVWQAREVPVDAARNSLENGGVPLTEAEGVSSSNSCRDQFCDLGFKKNCTITTTP